MTQEAPDNAVSFFWVDVFAERPLEGNPVAVVPDAARLTEATMQRIAREFNQSETTFVLPPTRSEADWRLRSFTPAGREAFGAGHNTLGAWWWLAESGVLDVGRYRCLFHAGSWPRAARREYHLRLGAGDIRRDGADVS